jgi:predicted Zn-dependent protease
MSTLIKRLLILSLASLAVACGTNPVTGDRELQFISTNQEIQMGEQAYLPGRQMQGGDYVVNPKLTRYVQSVNQRLANVSDRDLPYEIVILNSSVPNAWAMPGGKMAINRGLLTELSSEAELAAVLGHEIVHAAARHGAKSQERGVFLQGGVLATQIATGSGPLGSLIGGGAMAGASLLDSSYGRDDELEADLYGMEYMVRAGYNPQAAVDLQQTFVRLSGESDSNWLEGLLASHPPSVERVDRNRETAKELGGAQLKYGRKAYQQAIAPLLKDQPAYQALDDALAAAKEEDFDKAASLVDKAIRLQPKEPKFYGLKGDLALQNKQYKSASKQFDKAISLYPDYFAFHLHLGYARLLLDDKKGATASLERSNDILPTASAQKILGDLALERGEREQALEYYSAASRSDSEIGVAASAALTRLELPENPSKYIRTQIGLNDAEKIVIAVDNLSPLPVAGVVVMAAQFDNAGNQISEIRRFKLKGTLKPQTRELITTNLPKEQGWRSAVEKARVVDLEKPEK